MNCKGFAAECSGSALWEIEVPLPPKNEEWAFWLLSEASSEHERNKFLSWSEFSPKEKPPRTLPGQTVRSTENSTRTSPRISVWISMKMVTCCGHPYEYPRPVAIYLDVFLRRPSTEDFLSPIYWLQSCVIRGSNFPQSLDTVVYDSYTYCNIFF